MLGGHFCFLWSEMGSGGCQQMSDIAGGKSLTAVVLCEHLMDCRFLELWTISSERGVFSSSSAFAFGTT